MTTPHPHQILTAAEAVNEFAITPTLFKSWVRRGRLTPTSHVWDDAIGRPVYAYRRTDIEPLVARWIQATKGHRETPETT